MPWYTCVVKINHKQLFSYFSKITFNFKITVKTKQNKELSKGHVWSKGQRQVL